MYWFFAFCSDRSLESDVYNMAVSLAGTYKVPLWEVFMAHLEFLFDESWYVS
jgi:hypothetical protein